MTKKYLLFVILLSLLILPLVSAGVTNLGIFKINDCVILKQSCGDCNYNIITRITNPDSTLGLLGPQTMTKTAGTTYNYSFCNTTQAGTYIVDGYGDLHGTDTIWNYYFDVTATGSDSTTGKSMTYIFIFLFVLVIFTVLLIIGLSAPGSNKEDEMTGYIIAVSNIKYVKYVCIGLAWVLGVFLSYLSWMISFAYLDFPFVTNILKFGFYSITVLTFPLFVIFCYIVIANLIRDSKIKEALERGFQVSNETQW